MKLIYNGFNGLENQNKTPKSKIEFRVGITNYLYPPLFSTMTLYHRLKNVVVQV